LVGLFDVFDVCNPSPHSSLLESVTLINMVNQSQPEVPTGFQEVKVPGFHDNGTAWW